MSDLDYPQKDFRDIIALEALKDGDIRSFSLDGQSIILIRDGNAVYALGGKCPHKDAPMEQGVFCRVRDGRGLVVCPWHKAVFDVDDGRLVEPVALDPLPRYPVNILEGRVLVGTRPLPAAGRKATQPEDTVLILGAGAAGVMAATTLRQEGFAGTITMVSEEDIAPYDRTALSKTVLLGGGKSAHVPPLRPEKFYADHDIRRVHGRVQTFDPSSRTAILADGTRLSGDHVLIATGARPRKTGLPGEHLEGVYALHRASDAEAIAAIVKDDQAVTIIGAGFIGLEVASMLRQRGVGVTIVTRSDILLESRFGREIGTRLRQLHEENGVAFVSDVHVTRICGDERAESVELSDGMRLPAAFVLLGTGVEPASDGIDGLERDDSGAIVVDHSMKAAPGVYAAGDVSALRRDDGQTYRIEHWRHAQIQGKQAALAMLGRPEALPVPWFWTQQFGKKIESLGWGGAFDNVLLQGDIKGFKFLATYVRAGQPVALAGTGYAAEMARAAIDFDAFVKENA